MLKKLLWVISALICVSRFMVKSADLAHLPPVYNTGHAPPSASLIIKPYILPSVLRNTILQSTKKNAQKPKKPSEKDGLTTSTTKDPLGLNFVIQPNLLTATSLTLTPTLVTIKPVTLKLNLINQNSFASHKSFEEGNEGVQLARDSKIVHLNITKHPPPILIQRGKESSIESVQHVLAKKLSQIWINKHEEQHQKMKQSSLATGIPSHFSTA